MGRILPHLIDQVSIDQFVAFSSENSSFEEALEFVPVEALAGRGAFGRSGIGMGTAGMVDSFLLYRRFLGLKPGSPVSPRASFNSPRG